MKIFSNIAKFFNEIKVEMTKVSWSTKEEVLASTGIVIVSTALLAVFIGVVDIVLSRIINLLLR